MYVRGAVFRYGRRCLVITNTASAWLLNSFVLAPTHARYAWISHLSASILDMRAEYSASTRLDQTVVWARASFFRADRFTVHVHAYLEFGGVRTDLDCP